MACSRAYLLSTDGEPVDVCTETLNKLHCKHDRWIVHAVLHAVSQMNIILLHQYKLIADQQVNGLDVVTIVLTTCYQAPANIKIILINTMYNLAKIEIIHKSTQRNINKKAMLSQGELRDATISFNTTASLAAVGPCVAGFNVFLHYTTFSFTNLCVVGFIYNVLRHVIYYYLF